MKNLSIHKLAKELGMSLQQFTDNAESGDYPFCVSDEYRLEILPDFLRYYMKGAYYEERA